MGKMACMRALLLRGSAGDGLAAVSMYVIIWAASPACYSQRRAFQRPEDDARVRRCGLRLLLTLLCAGHGDGEGRW